MASKRKKGGSKPKKEAPKPVRRYTLAEAIAELQKQGVNFVVPAYEPPKRVVESVARVSENRKRGRRPIPPTYAAALDEMAEKMAGTAYTHQNRDYTIDSEIRIRVIDGDWSSAFRDIESQWRHPGSCRVSFGLFFPPGSFNEQTDVESIWGGELASSTYYHVSKWRDTLYMASEFLTYAAEKANSQPSEAVIRFSIGRKSGKKTAAGPINYITPDLEDDDD